MHWAASQHHSARAPLDLDAHPEEREQEIGVPNFLPKFLLTRLERTEANGSENGSTEPKRAPSG